jgi:hypothetical protein
MPRKLLGLKEVTVPLQRLNDKWRGPLSCTPGQGKLLMSSTLLERSFREEEKNVTMGETTDEPNIIDVSTGGEAACRDRDRSTDCSSVVSSRKRALERTGGNLATGKQVASRKDMQKARRRIRSYY